jgi:hypothetical protein
MNAMWYASPPLLRHQTSKRPLPWLKVVKVWISLFVVERMLPFVLAPYAHSPSHRVGPVPTLIFTCIFFVNMKIKESLFTWQMVAEHTKIGHVKL